jgi:hypothetical protein
MTFMAEDRVQLKQEEVVGNELVLTDINPKSNTKSIDDPTTGATLEKTIERIWNAINNKLSRIVNSVNGMTGVVIIDAATIGLGNVDNVSFADIKEWVISRIMQEMGYKRIEMFESLQELDETINTVWNNDEIYANKPFYARHGYQNDKRGYIGYIYYDNNRLQHAQKALDTVGSADNTIIYNENVNGRQYAESGRIGVNIWKYEDALKVYNDLSDNKSESGLYIDKSKIKPTLYWFDGVYGSGDPADSGALLYYSGGMPTDVHEVTFRIDRRPVVYPSPDTQFGGTNFIKQSFEKGDIIICNFNDELYLQDPVGTGTCRTLTIGMNPMLMIRKPAIGMVTQAPTAENPDTDYIIDFYTMRQPLFKGLKYENIHTASSDIGSEALSVDLLHSEILEDKNQESMWGDTGDVPLSGINAFSPYDTATIHQTRNNVPKRSFKTILPTGLSGDIYRTDTDGSCNEKGSMFILPNYSLCVIPKKVFNDGNSLTISNWPPAYSSGYVEPNPQDKSPIPDRHENPSFLGINLVKGIYTDTVDHKYATNLSGLRVDEDTINVDSSWLGNPSASTITNHSGGLSVNVGDFLEIGSSDNSYSVKQTRTDYYNEGKVNVRIDKTKGLYNVIDDSDNPTNSLGINIAKGIEYQPEYGNRSTWNEGGLHFVDGGITYPEHGLLAVNTARGLSGLTTYSTHINEYFYDGSSTILFDYDHNVLGIKPYKFYKPSHVHSSDIPNPTDSCLETHLFIDEEFLGRKINIPNLYKEKQWPSIMELEMEYSADPTKFDEDHVYIAGKRYYIFSSNLETPGFTYYFSIHGSQLSYDLALDSIRNGQDLIGRHRTIVLVEQDPEVVGRSLVKVSRYIEAVTDRRIPDVTNDGIIDGRDATLIQTLWAKNNRMAYYKDGNYFSDPECTALLASEEGEIYTIGNLYIEGTNVRAIREGHNYMMRNPIIDGLELTDTLIARADALRDGPIPDNRDATAVLSFYGRSSTGEYEGLTTEESWFKYLLDEHSIYVSPDGDPIVELASFYYEPGVKVRYNEYKGLTTNNEYVYNDETDIRAIAANDYRDELGIKIADKTSGYAMDDSKKNGGLRFNAGGYLSIRINATNSYSAVERSKHDGCDTTTVGTHGLRIFKGNILGIQLKGELKDNGDLCIDKDGNLTISPNFVPLKHKLTFKGYLNDTPNHLFEFTGSEDTTIELGPGLCFTEEVTDEVVP